MKEILEESGKERIRKWEESSSMKPETMCEGTWKDFGGTSVTFQTSPRFLPRFLVSLRYFPQDAEKLGESQENLRETWVSKPRITVNGT